MSELEKLKRELEATLKHGSDMWRQLDIAAQDVTGAELPFDVKRALMLEVVVKVAALRWTSRG